MRPSLVAWVALLLAGPVAPVQAAPALGLAEAVQLALEHHPLVKVADLQLEAARAREIHARALPNPGLTVAADSMPFTNPGLGNLFAGVSQTLWVAGQGELRGQLGDLEVAIAELGCARTRRDLVRDVKVAFARVTFMRERVRLARLEREAAEEQARSAEALVKAGEVAPIERVQAEVEVGRLMRELTRLESQLRDATGRLAVLVGRSPAEALEVADLPPVAGASGSAVVTWPSADALVLSALEGRAELKQAALAVSREALQRRLAEAGVWDGTEASLAGGTFSGLPGFTATVTWPIPVYRQQGAIAEAEANRARSEAERSALRSEVELEVRGAVREAVAARESFQLHAATLVPRAAEGLDQARRRYRAGEGSGLEVIAARRSLAEVQVAREQALLELREAIARLEALSGMAIAL